MKKLYIFLMAFFAAAACLAQPLRIYVGWAAGGPGDIMARALAKELTKAGTETIIVNKTGADGLIAINDILTRKNDPYQLLFSTIGTTTIASATNPEYNEKFKNLTPLVAVSSGYSMIVVHSKTGIKSFPQLIDAINAAPRNIAATSGQNSVLVQTVFGKSSNANIVSYPGDAPIMVQLLGGHIDTAFVSTNNRVLLESIANGTIVPLATTHNTTIDGVPPLTQFGVNHLFAQHYVLFGLQDMSAEVSTKIFQAITNALETTEMQNFLKQNNYLLIAPKDQKYFLTMPQTLFPKIQKHLQSQSK